VYSFAMLVAPLAAAWVGKAGGGGEWESKPYTVKPVANEKYMF
jgi:hypothetical protein